MGQFKDELRAEAELFQSKAASEVDQAVTITDVDNAYSYIRRYGSSASNAVTWKKICVALLSYVCSVVVGVAGNNAANGFGWVVTFVVAALIGGAAALYVVWGDKK